MNAANLNGKAANPEFAYLYFYTPQILYIRDMQAKQTYHLCLIDQTAKQQKLLVKTICADDKGNIAVGYTADESYAVDAWRYIGVQEIFEQMQPCAFAEGES